METDDPARKHDVVVARAEVAALRAELSRLRGSFRMRVADLVAEALRSPAGSFAALRRLLALVLEFRNARRWRSIVLQLECGLPDDPLRRMAPAVAARAMLAGVARGLVRGVLQGLDSGNDAALDVAIARAHELERLARDGPTWPARALRSRTGERRVAMALHVGEADVVNGYTRRSQELLKALAQEGWGVDALLRGAEPVSAPYARIGDVSAGSPGLDAYVSAYAAKLQPVVAARGAGLVHAASNHVTGRAGAIAARRLGLPFVYEVRGLWEVTRASVEPAYAGSLGYRGQQRMEIETARIADGVVVNGSGLRDYFIAAGIDEKKISVVPNGCDAEDAQDQGAADLASRFGLDPDTPVVGFVGSLTTYEGLNTVFSALARLGEMRFQVLIVGDGPARQGLEEAARREGVAARVRWAGQVSPALAKASYKLIDIAPMVRADTPVTRLVPPLKPLEAMAAGSALIVSDLPALAEFAEEGRALLAPAGDIDALSACICALLDDADMRRAQAARARMWVRAERTWPQTARRISAVWEQLLSN